MVNFFTAYGEQHHHEPIDVEQKLGDMEFHGLDGNGIDDTKTSVSAALLNRYRPVDEAVIERVVEEVLEGVRATPGTEGFDWKREATHVREKCLSWIEKHPEIADPAWLKQKYPKLAKQAEAEQKSKLPELEFYHLGNAAAPAGWAEVGLQGVHSRRAAQWNVWRRRRRQGLAAAATGHGDGAPGGAVARARRGARARAVFPDRGRPR